jgi:hypothetical protein
VKTRVLYPPRWTSATPSITDLIVADLTDDESSIRVKLRAASGRRVGLVLPDDTDVYDTPLAIHVLARTALDEGVNLTIVSRRRQVRRWSAAEGIPCVGHASGLPRVAGGADFGLVGLIRLAFRFLPSLVASASSWIVALGTIFSLGALTFLLVPRAVITVRPATDGLASTVQLVVSVNATDPDPTKGILPGRQVYLLVEGSGTLPISRPNHPADGHAVGWLTVENRTPDVQTIPRGTDVSTYGGAHFATTSAASLPAQSGATTTIPIRAVAPGSGSNVRRGEIVVVNGPLHWRVAAVNEEPTAGGGPAGRSIVTPWDTRDAVQQVASTAREESNRQIAEQLAPGEQPIPETTELSPIDEAFTRQLGDVAPDLGLDAHFRASAIIYNQDQLKNMAIQIWHPTIRAGYALREDSVDVGPGKVTAVTSDTVTFSVPIHAIAYKIVNADRIAALARFRTAATIEADLRREYDLAAPATVFITPGWVNRAMRVSVVVDTNSPSGPGQLQSAVGRGSA